MLRDSSLLSFVRRGALSFLVQDPGSQLADPFHTRSLQGLVEELLLGLRPLSNGSARGEATRD